MDSQAPNLELGAPNILVIAPHPDDESIGCGGAICLHAARGHRVSAVFLTSGELGLKSLPPEQAWKVRENEATAAGNVLGVSNLFFLRGPDSAVDQVVEDMAARLTPVLVEVNPHTVYLPHPGDSHPDHQAALSILSLALNLWGKPPPVLWGYEVWGPMSYYDHVEDITPVMIIKLRAMRCHLSQMNQLRYDRAIQGLGAYRGAAAYACRYAEVFQNLNHLVV